MRPRMIPLQMSLPLVLRTLAGLLASAALVVLAGAPAAGQGQLSSKAELEVPFSAGRSRLNNELINGNKQPSAPGDKDLIKVAAKWYIHRLTWTGPTTDPKEMHQVIQEFRDRLINPTISPTAIKTNRAFVELLGPALVESAQAVFQAPMVTPEDRLIQVNVATLLPLMAQLKQDDVGTYLAELARDPTKHDAVRVYALMGLKEYMPAQPFIAAKAIAAHIKRKPLDLKRVNALVDYVEGKVPSKVNTNDADVTRYLRREALETLSHVGLPTVEIQAAPFKMDGVVAPTLLKVLAKKGLDPESGLPEKIEAAIGLATMKYPEMPEYRPEVAIYLFGRLVEELTNEYNRDFTNFSKQRPRIEWKIQSKRLELALRDMVANAVPTPVRSQMDEAGTKKAHDNAKILDKLATPILQKINTLNRLDYLPGYYAAYHAAIESIKPSTGAVFRVGKGPEIDLSAPTTE